MKEAEGKNPEFEFLRKIDKEANKQNFDSLYEDVVAGHHDTEKAFDKAHQHIQTARTEQRRFINPTLLIDDLRTKATDQTARNLYMGQIDSLVANKKIEDKDYSEVMICRLKEIVKDNRENLKLIKSIKRPNKFI